MHSLLKKNTSFTVRREGLSLPAAIASLLLLVPLFSCNREILPVDGKEGVAPRAELSFEVSIPSTKASATGHEDDIVSLDIFLFRSGTGLLDASRRVTGSRVAEASVDALAGVPLDWVVVANAPEGAFASVSTESELLSESVSLSDHSLTSLIMSDSGTVTVSGGGETRVSATLRRYVSKVSVQTLSMSWLSSFTTPPTMTLGRIVLMDAPVSMPLSGVQDALCPRVNVTGIDPSLGESETDMLIKDYSLLPLTTPAAIDIDSPLYCMSDPLADTYIAVEVVIDGTSNWYPVGLPALECNTHYVITNLSLTGPGAPTPVDPIARTNVSFTVEVTPWTESGSTVEFPME